MKSLTELKRAAREAQEAFEARLECVLRDLRPGDVVVNCDNCDRVFVTRDDGRPGWYCPCSPSVLRPATRRIVTGTTVIARRPRGLDA